MHYQEEHFGPLYLGVSWPLLRRHPANQQSIGRTVETAISSILEHIRAPDLRFHAGRERDGGSNLTSRAPAVLIRSSPDLPESSSRRTR